MAATLALALLPLAAAEVDTELTADPRLLFQNVTAGKTEPARHSGLCWRVIWEGVNYTWLCSPLTVG